MKIRRLLGVGLVTTVAALVCATVTFDSATGTGFVGKGDVQTAFGWNNAMLQANVAGVTFTFDSTETTTGVCEWTTSEGKKSQKTHSVTHSSTSGINSVVNYTTRNNRRGDVTGFYLTGYGKTLSSSTSDDENWDNPNYPMVEGGACPGNNGNGATWVSVDTVHSGDGLVVHYGALSQPLTITPTVVP